MVPELSSDALICCMCEADPPSAFMTTIMKSSWQPPKVTIESYECLASSCIVV